MLGSGLAGLTSGGAYALLGLCIVLMSRITGVVNFALGAIATSGVFVAIELTNRSWAYLPAAVVGVAVGAAISTLCGAVMVRWFAEASTERRSTVTIAILIGLLAGGLQVFGTDAHNVPGVLQSGVATVSGTTLSGATFAAVAISVLLAATLATALERTALGVRMRAVSERPTTAELHGLPAKRLALYVWAFTGAVATIGVLLVAPTRPSGFFDLSMLVLPALAAALVGLFNSLTWTVAGGLVLGVLDGAITSDTSLAPYRQAIPFLLILAALLWFQRREVWDVAR